MTSVERKIATMLFADLVGSTEFASSEDPEHTRVLLDRFYDAMAEEIEATGGTIEKFAGDAVMAVFGVPVAHEDHAERALHTALAMRRHLRGLFGDRLELRIGVNTGEVVVGRPRMGSSFVSGDAVNVAARLEQRAAPGETLVGERTAAAVGGAFDFSERLTIEAKGKEGGVVARRLLAALAVARPRGGLGEAFVGRGSELEILEATYARVVERGRPELLAVVGDAGVGKSRLLAELSRRLGRQPSRPLERSGRCLSYGRGLTYRPLADVLRQELGLLDSDPPAQALERLGERAILGLALGLDVTGNLHPLVVRERFQNAWTELLAELVTQQPVVLVIEDLHWAEQPLLELLGELRRRIDGPLLLVTTARPEGTELLSEDVRLDLAPLTAEDAEDMVATLLGDELPPPVRDLVVARAEGNPFFIEELLATLIDRRLLARVNGGWRIDGSLDELDLPDTVQAVLAARIDLLPEAEKRALQAASVIGRIFWDAPVQALVDDLEPSLDLLEQRDFVRASAESSLAGEREYSFKHQLTREVAYSSLPKAERGRLHAAVARRLARGDADARAALLAHHYEQAVRDDYAELAWRDDAEELGRLRQKALHWLQRASESAASRYELDAAVSMLERALELAEDDSTRFELWRALASAHALRYDAKGFVSASERAVELAPDDGAVTSLYAELALRSGTAERLVALVDEIADPGPKEMLLQNTALRVAAVAGRFDEARRFSELIDRLVRELTPHHRLHGIAYALEIEELAGGWNRIRELESRVERAVEENRETPCVRNARSLLVCALAEAALGDDDRMRRFEGLAGALGMAGHERVLDPPRMRLALLRGDTGEVRRLLERYGRPRLRFLFDFAGAAAWLDAAVALGLRSSIEQEAPALARPGTCIEPFALRALGIAREDATLLERADRRFAELGLHWYAEQTKTERSAARR